MNGFLINNTISKNISFLCDDLNFDINGKVIFNGKELNPLELMKYIMLQECLVMYKLKNHIIMCLRKEN
jgi:hypothetical protein